MVQRKILFRPVQSIAYLATVNVYKLVLYNLTLCRYTTLYLSPIVFLNVSKLQ